MKSAIRQALLVLTLGSMSAVAAAGNAAASLPQRTVRYSDLNLDSPGGAAALYQRIRAAARAVCESPVASDRQAEAFVERCAREAIKRAVDAVNAPRVTDYYLISNRPALTFAQR